MAGTFRYTKMTQLDIEIRSASSDDLEAIMKALRSLSDEIPIKMDTNENQEALHKTVAECCGQSSWVAFDKADHVVRFLLSKKYGDGFELPYGGVLAGYQKQGLFFRILSKAKELKRPLYVTVSHANKSNMATILAKGGFTKDPWPSYKQDYFIWKP
jgi:hypothetical protein